MSAKLVCLPTKALLAVSFTVSAAIYPELKPLGDVTLRS